MPVTVITVKDSWIGEEVREGITELVQMLTPKPQVCLYRRAIGKFINM